MHIAAFRSPTFSKLGRVYTHTSLIAHRAYPHPFSAFRPFSTTFDSDLVKIEQPPGAEHVIFELNRKPANSLNLEVSKCDSDISLDLTSF